MKYLGQGEAEIEKMGLKISEIQCFSSLFVFVHGKDQRPFYLLRTMSRKQIDCHCAF